MKLNYENLKKYFGQRLKELRIEKGITQEDLGKVLGVTKGTISRYENGISSPGVSEVKLLSEYFNVNFYWLAGTSDDKYNYNPTFNKIPVLGKIACGAPIYASDYIVDYEYISNKDNVHFALIAKGDSMVGARINDGDIVFIRQQSDVDSGEIAAVLIDCEEATLKRVYKINGGIMLHSENPNYPNTIINAKDHRDVKILGKAVAFKSRII